MKRWGIFASAVLILGAALLFWRKQPPPIPSGSPTRKPPGRSVTFTNELNTVTIQVLARTNLPDGRAGIVLGVTNNSHLYSFRYYCQAEVKSNGTWHAVTGWDPDERTLNDLRPEKALRWAAAHPEGASVWRVKFFGVQVFANQTLHQAKIKLNQAGALPGPNKQFVEYSPEIETTPPVEGNAR